MKPRATLLALFALAFLSIDAAAQSRPEPRRNGAAPTTAPAGSFERRKWLKSPGKSQEIEYGSVARRALLTTGKLPACIKKKPERRFYR
jgi:hypothetical protein